MTKIKTSELEGAALDWAVAKCEGVAIESFMSAQAFAVHAYQYSTGWAQGGPIIEREQIYLGPDVNSAVWFANTKGIGSKGPAPLIAAMRCYVASKLGDVVDVPDELVGT